MENSSAFPELLGSTPAMDELQKIIDKVAPTRATVLIEGESGTGKELVARAIHHNSRRATGPFIAINCAALPENLLESELFGHERGAFTGADAARRGEFELADGGTLFLDEIAELSFAMQAKLLRALQERVIRRIGREQPIPIDVRFIAATSRDLQTGFRPELYYRLKVISIQTTPLRDRWADIPILVQHFIKRFEPEAGRTVSGLSAEAEAALTDYDWPGNIRQLEGVIQQAMVLGSSSRIELEDLPRDIAKAADVPSAYEDALKVFKRRIVGRALAKAGGDYRQAAADLGLYHTSLHRIMRQVGLNK